MFFLILDCEILYQQNIHNTANICYVMLYYEKRLKEEGIDQSSSLFEKLSR